MKTLLIILALQFLQSGYSIPDCASTLEIKNKNCEYSIKYLKGWHIIPSDTLNIRFGKGFVDAGFYNAKNENYFDGDYIQYIFIPTVKSLNQLLLLSVKIKKNNGY